MLFVIFALAIIAGLAFGFLAGHAFRRYALIRKAYKRAARKILSKIGNKTADELLTHRNEVLRQYGLSLQGEVSDGLLNQMWGEINKEDKLEQDLSDYQFHLRIWPIIGAFIILVVIVIIGAITLREKMYIDAGFKLERLPDHYEEVWVK